ncbi:MULTISPECIES: xanthine dehydrogenase family protein molybdopterin-binding subunit [unclassified Chelatococcus]|uniref:xanthine dehydrogenase family protein molybdopterin-binding subunit n=1 Tax=unclassified Chelatococcus TaxID=2638111 RepID=UPI001BCD2900|nr:MULTISPECIES: xanthine dehydrogenase family protein molybdopterin-binding subunit [unclassified Chelatococcus]CAH1651003.1 Xanthine dehydrogenase molybdenum binding subunit apoprotein [Hyphomicrobiales bacterium]MBS7743230.1 xanthine dehydrogenase family protein molybdopterin-binding subunit [Chelatococcus sp. HY11]MBX3541652.1 xanthine dehydrogenase family protein molybdopterin-binding subunit [Chelatococcus sp.]MCO5074456.1 xanthine dehydrogenase family protein molybdopterin-binding subuni
MSWIGRSLPRLEDPSLLMGRGRYVADLARGVAAVKFVRSPVAAGRILSIDVPEGELVFTAADLAGVKPICPILHRPDYIAVEQPILAKDRVMFCGQALAVVVADDQSLAEDLAEQVFADIDAEDAIVDMDTALAEGATAVHAHAPGNVLVEGAMRSPGLDAAFTDAAEIISLDLRSGRQSAMPLEGRGGVAQFDRISGRVTLYASVQMPHMLRTGLADVLQMPEADLRVVAPDVGGGFGQKMSLFPEYVVLVWLARKLERDVAWIEDRRENFLASSHSRDQSFRVRGAFAKDGTLLGIDADLKSNVGAFSCYPVTCGVEPLMALAELPGPYKLAEYGVRSRGVTTNTGMMAPYRGVSRPMLTLTMERMMDVAAKRLGIDPIEIRRRNLIDTFPHRSPTGLVYDEGSYKEAMDRAVEAIDLTGFRARQREARAEGRYLGIGFSVFSERTGYGTPAYAARGMNIVPGYEIVSCAMDPSGFVEARIGSSPHGQGLKTALAQLIADELGVEPAMVKVISGDTDATPYGWGTFASRSMVIAGGACKLAAGKVATRLRSVAAVMMQADADHVVLEDGLARVTGTNQSLPIPEVARASYHQSHRFPQAGPGLIENATYDPGGTFSNACHACIVEVDIETGGVKIERFVVAEDAGVLINPMIVDGQIHGGVAQGIANALFEELVYDETGNLLTVSLADYLPPTIAEVPKIEIEHLVTLSDATITKAKGVGEGGAIGAPAAIINATVDALSPFGVEIFQIPATPQHIRKLIREAERNVHG